jgi:hypothetical protein
MIPVLISLSESDKRFIFSILIVVIVLLVLIGFLGYALFRLMKWQSKKMDTLIHDVVYYKVITDRKHLIKYGRSKNWAMFFKQAYIALIIALVGVVVLLVHNAVYDYWNYNPFSTYDGFGTIFWTWKYSGEYSGTEYDLIRFRLIVVDNTPHVVDIAWAGYVCAPLFIVGGAWYIVAASCLLSRTFLLYKRSREVFEKSLAGFRQNEAPQVNQSNNTNNNESTETNDKN